MAITARRTTSFAMAPFGFRQGAEQEAVLRSALAVALRLSDAAVRADAILALAPHLTETLLSEALAGARAIEDEPGRYAVLDVLLPHVTESVANDFIKTVGEINDVALRGPLLMRLTEFVPEALLPELFEEIWALPAGITQEAALDSASRRLLHSEGPSPVVQELRAVGIDDLYDKEDSDNSEGKAEEAGGITDIDSSAFTSYHLHLRYSIEIHNGSSIILRTLLMEQHITKFLEFLNENYALKKTEVDISELVSHIMEWAVSGPVAKTTEAQLSVVRQAEHFPRDLAEAKAQTPGLLTWAEAQAVARKAGRSIAIVDHLRDTETGWGRWTLRAPGLPRGTLHDLDEGAYKALYAWLGKIDPVTQERNRLPDDLYLPRRSDVARGAVSLTADDAKEARRVASLLHRMAANQRGDPSR